MRSSHRNTARRSRGPYRGRIFLSASNVGRGFRPIPRAPNPGNDLRSQLYDMRYNGRRFIAFLSILLGDGQVLDEGVTGSKILEGRGGTSGTDHDTMQPHGGELAHPTTTLWLPENLKNRAATLGYKNGEDFLNNMRMIFREVLKFGARATHVAKAFARMEFHLVQNVRFNAKDLRVALQALVDGTGNKLPLLDPLLPNIVESIGFVPSASYILEPRPPSVGSDAGDIPSQLRAQFYDSEQFYIFLSILLGEDHPPDDSLQPRRASTTTLWLPQYLTKRDAIPDSSGSQCWDQLIGAFREFMEFGAKATRLAKGFARLKYEHAQFLLRDPESLRLMLPRIDAISVNNNTGELFLPEMELDPNTRLIIRLYAVPEEFVLDVESMDDDYIKLSVFRYFGQM